ncbi:hypothetical protein WJX81_008569 [Elliptochloris bilobata]|uniref:CP12 domain-containing protein n=1 Tax=Elliptochloris bilobata TaxID=381761 RepID=A0AAW1RI33_9CHLO
MSSTMLASRPTCLAGRPAIKPTAARRPLRLASQPRSRTIVRVDPTKDSGTVETAIKEAKDTCADGTAGECAAAWDSVEELSAAAAHRKVAQEGQGDPLEKYCGDNPEADECRVYED